jgi:hypothetical protein
VINAGSNSDSISVFGNLDTVNTGTGDDTINISGTNDTIVAGAQDGNTTAQINLSGSNTTITDGPNVYNDTVIGFSQAAGDRIHLTGSDTTSYALSHTSPQNGGQDTLITLNDGSTILLKGVSSINSSFFS